MESKTLPLSRLQSNLTCSICSGYLIDATTITECMHTCEYIAVAPVIIRPLSTHHYLLEPPSVFVFSRVSFVFSKCVLIIS